MAPPVDSVLLSSLSARLAREPLVYAGAYGSRFGGWARPDSDLDLVIAYGPAAGAMDWRAADALKGGLRAIADRHHVGLDFSIGLSLFDHVHPAQVATFLVGPRLAGDPAAATDTATIALASRARDQRTRAALAAAKRASAVFAPGTFRASVALGARTLAGALDDLAAAAGYLRCDGKDRREPAVLRHDLLAGRPPADRDLLDRLYAGAVAENALPAAATLLEIIGHELRGVILARLP